MAPTAPPASSIGEWAPQRTRSSYDRSLCSRKVKNSWSTTWGEAGYIRFARGSDMCRIGEQVYYPDGVKPAPSSPPYALCSGSDTICECTTGCGLLPGETTPCAVPAGTNCDAGFSNAKCCSFPACDRSKALCKCTNGCGIPSSSQKVSFPCACAASTTCSAGFSGCSCCGGSAPAAFKGGRKASAALAATGGHPGE